MFLKIFKHFKITKQYTENLHHTEYMCYDNI